MKKGAKSTTGPKARMIQRFFYLYMEWRDKACFEAHIATPHVKHAEDRLKREKMLIEPAKEWHFYRL
jgi:quinol monooxygenase YgiN